jgi:16S rRNA (guanine527-N7)-methyltransferase
VGARRIVDLGSGGGVPGLVLALELPGTAWLLLDSNTRRTAFLGEAVEQLGLVDRVRIWEGRAEVAGRDPAVRAGADAVVARGFAGPAVTAECAAPLLGVGGRLIVSEPPGTSGERWDPAALHQLGLGPPRLVQGDYTYVILEQGALCPDRFPRRVGVPGKRPLF